MAGALFKHQAVGTIQGLGRIRAFAGSLLITLIAQAVTLLSVFLITRLSVHLFGSIGFAQYQVARRTLSVVALPLMCGLGVSLPRHIARDIHHRDRVARWLLASLCMSVVLIVGLLVLGAMLSNSVGRLIFGCATSNVLVFSVLIASAGMFSSTLAAGAMRGLSRFKTTATLQVINGAVVPLVGVVCGGARAERALTLSGLIWFAIAVYLFSRLIREWITFPIGWRPLLGSVVGLLRFGAPRVPGDIALFGFFALPGYAAVHRGDILGAGILSVGLSLIQAIAVAFASTGFVLLPYWSSSTKNREGMVSARKYMGWLVIASAILAAVGTGVMEACLHPIARLLLGPVAEAGLQDIRYVLLGTVPYVIYLVLRDYLDAISEFPLNSVGLACAIAIQAVLLNLHALSVSLATASGFLALGISMIALWRFSPRFVSAGSRLPAA